MTELTIRDARTDDIEFLVRFNRNLAQETEGLTLDADTLRCGVQALFDDPSLGFYLVAVSQQRVVGCLMITKEWSDWRNGVFWWVQSVYVEEEFRRQGIFRQLYAAVQSLASEKKVCGFRLYVERENVVAQNTYRDLGMCETPYKMFEQLTKRP